MNDWIYEHGDRAGRKSRPAGRGSAYMAPRRVMALEALERERRAERRMKALYRAAVLQPGEFSRGTIRREDLIEASRELQHLAARSPRRRGE